MLSQNNQNLINKRLYRKLKCESLNEIREKLILSKNINVSNSIALQSERTINNQRKLSPNFLKELFDKKLGKSNYTFNSLIFNKNSKSPSIARTDSRESFDPNKSALEVILNNQKKNSLINHENRKKNNGLYTSEKESRTGVNFSNTENSLENYYLLLDFKNKEGENNHDAINFQNFNDNRKKINHLNSKEKLKNYNTNNNQNNGNSISNDVLFENKIRSIKKEKNFNIKSKNLFDSNFSNNKITEDEEDFDLIDYTENEAKRAKNSSINNSKLPKLKLDFQKIKNEEKSNLETFKNKESYIFQGNLISIENENLDKQSKINQKQGTKACISNKINNESQNIKIKSNTLSSRLSKNLIFNNYNEEKNMKLQQLNIKNKILNKSKNDVSADGKNKFRASNGIETNKSTFINNITINKNNLIYNNTEKKNEDCFNKNSDKNEKTINLNLNLNVNLDLKLNNDFIKTGDAFLYRLKTSRDKFLKNNLDIKFCNNQMKNDDPSHNLYFKKDENQNKTFSIRNNSIKLNNPSYSINHTNSNINNTFNNYQNKVLKEHNNKNSYDFINESKTDRINDDFRKNHKFTNYNFFPELVNKNQGYYCRISHSRYGVQKSQDGLFSKEKIIGNISLKRDQVKNSEDFIKNLNSIHTDKKKDHSKNFPNLGKMIINIEKSNILPTSKLNSDRDNNPFKIPFNVEKKKDSQKIRNENIELKEKPKTKNGNLKKIENKNTLNNMNGYAQKYSINYANKYLMNLKDKKIENVNTKKGNLTDRV